MPKDQFNAWIIRVVTGFCIGLISLTGWFAVRMVDNYDSGLRNQEIMKESLNDLKNSAIGISGRIDLINLKVDESIKTETDHYHEVQKLQQRIYGN